ncbi:MAG: tRNA 4-thiouridine(8) synthase ThiI [Candidatus Omnitrophota bacterium]
MKAIAMLSGGLDSSLAIKVIQSQGIEVIALHCIIPFVKHTAETIGNSAAGKVSCALGCKLKVVTLSDEYLDIVENPKHGYGKNLNPCIDCKILMLKAAKRIMQEEGASFVITGEVLGQRPMSQHKGALNSIARESGLKGLLLRPLSAKLLDDTLVESRGWVKKDNLLDFSGRSRKGQMALARNYQIEEYPQPAGGCLLTDSYFSRRLEDIMKHKQYSFLDIELLKVGRHFRITPSYKLIVGRDEKENEKLLQLAQGQDLIFEPKDIAGPTGLGRGMPDTDARNLSARILARYTSLTEKTVFLLRNSKSSAEEELSAVPLDGGNLKVLMV